MTGADGYSTHGSHPTFFAVRSLLELVFSGRGHP